MKVCDLKNTLNNIIEKLDEFDDMAEITLESNTSGMNGDFIYIDGYRERGYIDLDNIEPTEE